MTFDKQSSPRHVERASNRHVITHCTASTVACTSVTAHRSLRYHRHDTPPSIWPHVFRGAGHEKRRGEQMKWSLAFRLYIGSFPCAQLPGLVHTRLGRVFFCVFSLGLCFVYFFDLFVCPRYFVFPWSAESSPGPPLLNGRCTSLLRSQSPK